MHAAEICPESDLERRIVTDPVWREGVRYGKPRPGHPEGSVLAHIHEVLENVDRYYGDFPTREELRLIALLHDCQKSAVDRSRPKIGDNHHARLARKFAEQHIDAPHVLNVIEHHDDAYIAWRQAEESGDWERATDQAVSLLEKLGSDLPLFIAFYKCDNRTGDKSQASYDWFCTLMETRWKPE